MAGEIQLNNVTLATESGGTISLSGDVDTLTPTKTALNASGSAPIYACRAWVNFNGTGTVAIRASGNVSSVTDNGGTGDYTVNFTTAMADANYSAMGLTGVDSQPDINSRNKASGSVDVRTCNQSNGAEDCSIVDVAIFR